MVPRTSLSNRSPPAPDAQPSVRRGDVPEVPVLAVAAVTGVDPLEPARGHDLAVDCQPHAQGHRSEPRVSPAEQLEQRACVAGRGLERHALAFHAAQFPGGGEVQNLDLGYHDCPSSAGLATWPGL